MYIIEVEAVFDPETNERYWTFLLKRELRGSGVNNTEIYEVARSVSKSKSREDAVLLAKAERNRHSRRPERGKVLIPRLTSEELIVDEEN